MGDAGQTGFSDRRSLTEMFTEEWAPNGVTKPRTAEQRAAFREWELQAAVADWDCRERLNYDLVARQISIYHQQRFVDRHRADLAAWEALPGGHPWLDLLPLSVPPAFRLGQSRLFAVLSAALAETA
jgi:hypothetical protein